jgi:hypothetical protein
MTQVITFFDVLRKTSRHSGALADRAQKSAALEPRVNEGEGGERQSLAGRQGESCIMHAALSTMSHKARIAAQTDRTARRRRCSVRLANGHVAH